MKALNWALVMAIQATVAFSAEHDYPYKPVPFTSVHIHDEFWSPRIETNRTVTIPYAFDKCETTGRVANFTRAAEALRGELGNGDRKLPGYPFDDTDVYKVIEGASYALSVHPDPKLASYVDGLIAKIAAAQEKDGYLYTARTIDPEHPHPWSGPRRWMLEEDQSHELYDLGHLYEAAVAHYQATGKRTLLDVALKSANLLSNTFGPGKQTIWPGHQGIAMGLVKLYRVTGDERYLNLAKFMLDSRGPNGDAYHQSNLKVIDQTEAEGHAVRAAYMYSGMADVAAMTDDQAYVRAIDTIWQNVVGKKLYITGGIGSTGAGEAFGANYELPNMTAYNETCASVGNDFWNQRLFLLHGDARYVDVLERTLYNGLLSGVSLDGKSFFYPNPLESNGQHARSPWFGVACCPGNITRFMASVSGYMYATGKDSLYVNLYAASAADITLPANRHLTIEQATRYPWDGHVRITVTPQQAAAFAIKVRIPGWARNEPVPSDLYRFADPSTDAPVLKLNKKVVPLTIEKGYATLRRTWKAGDVIDLDLPMPVRRILANPKVAADQNRTAIQRGPIVYAAEWPDNPGHHVRNLVLLEKAALSAEFRPELLDGVMAVNGRAEALSYQANGQISRREQAFTAIPYYAWANRGRGQMEVWIAEQDAAAKPSAWPTLAIQSDVSASHPHTNPHSVKDGEEPESSSDPVSSFDWWPRKGTEEWIQYDFPKIATVSSSQVYWFDDTGSGEVRLPASWRLAYRDDGDWKPVEQLGAYGVAKDRYNSVRFKSVRTNGLRLEVSLQPGWSAGVKEWKVK